MYFLEKHVYVPHGKIEEVSDIQNTSFESKTHYLGKIF